MTEKPKSKKRSFNLQVMKEHAEKLGGQCLSEQYINSTYKLLFVCRHGHKWRARPLDVIGKKSATGTWCPECKKKETDNQS